MSPKKGKRFGSVPKVGDLVSLSEETLNKPIEQLESEPITIIHFEYALVDSGKYYPCEVGVLQFSFAGGISQTYHEFISPMPLPHGCLAAAKEHSEQTHQIPMVGAFPFWNDEFFEIAHNIRRIIGSNYRVYCSGSRDDLKTIAGCLDFLQQQAKYELGWVVLTPLETFAKCILQLYGLDQADAADEILTYFKRGCHDYDRNIRCSFHEQGDKPHCAQAKNFTLLYNFMDFLADKRLGQIDGAGKSIRAQLFRPAVVSVPCQQSLRFDNVACKDLPCNTETATQDISNASRTGTANISTPSGGVDATARVEAKLENIVSASETASDDEDAQMEMLPQPNLNEPTMVTASNCCVISVPVPEKICGIQVEPTLRSRILARIPKTYCGITVEPAANNAYYFPADNCVTRVNASRRP